MLQSAILVPVRIILLAPPNVIHNLVLAFPRDIWTREDYGGPFGPEGIGLHLVLYPLVHGEGQLQHEVSAGSDAIRVKGLAVGEPPLTRHHRRHELLGLLAAAEATAPLLIHLRAGRDPVNGEEEQLSWLGKLVKAVSVHENLLEHLRLIELHERIGVAVRAGVDDAIHVEVQAVDLCVHWRFIGSNIYFLVGWLQYSRVTAIALRQKRKRKEPLTFLSDLKPSLSRLFMLGYWSVSHRNIFGMPYSDVFDGKPCCSLVMHFEGGMFNVDGLNPLQTEPETALPPLPAFKKAPHDNANDKRAI